MHIQLTGDWTKAQAALHGSPQDIDQAMHAAVMGVAEYLAGKIKKKIGSNVPPPNSPFTLLMKKSAKTLIDNSDMRNAIGVIPVGRHNAFVGIPAAGGMARLADIQENGRTIVMRMTPKMRKFLHATLGQRVSKVGSGNGILVIHIPPRPFVAPTFAEEGSTLEARFKRLFIANLKRLNPQPAPTSATTHEGQKLVWVPSKKGGMVRRWVGKK